MKFTHRASFRALMISSFLPLATLVLVAPNAFADPASEDMPPPADSANAVAKPNVPIDPVRKQWVWLTKQGVWGYGYQRADGFWMIDAGTKLSPEDFKRTQREQLQSTVAPAVSSPTPAPAQAAAPASDPYGFVGWLNTTRASAGLRPVGIDPNLSSSAQQNNVQQQSRGLGHFVMGPARRQNSAVGNYAGIGAMWMASPAHRAALLDPTITSVGIAGLGVYWTYNAR